MTMLDCLTTIRLRYVESGKTGGNNDSQSMQKR